MACIATHNFKCVIQNQTADKVFVWRTKQTQEPIDLTDFQEIKIGLFTNENKAISTLSIGDGLAISGGNNEILTATFNQERTNQMSGIVLYELMFVRSSGENWYPLKGGMIVEKTNTR